MYAAASMYKLIIATNDNLAFTEAIFQFTQNTYSGLENVASPPGIPFAIQLAPGSGELTQASTVTVTLVGGSATGMQN